MKTATALLTARALDATFGQDRRLLELLGSVSFQDARHEDNCLVVEDIAASYCGLTPEMALAYTELQLWVREFRDSTNRVCTQEVARRLGVTPEELEFYAYARIEELPPATASFAKGDGENVHFRRFHANLVQEDDLQEARRLGMTLEQYRDYIADLQADAGLGGD